MTRQSSLICAWRGGYGPFAWSVFDGLFSLPVFPIHSLLLVIITTWWSVVLSSCISVKERSSTHGVHICNYSSRYCFGLLLESIFWYDYPSLRWSRSQSWKVSPDPADKLGCGWLGDCWSLIKQWRCKWLNSSLVKSDRVFFEKHIDIYHRTSQRVLSIAKRFWQQIGSHCHSGAISTPQPLCGRVWKSSHQQFLSSLMPDNGLLTEFQKIWL